MTRDELSKTVTDFMDRFTTMTLACSHEAKPWTAAVYYARQGFDLVFFSSPNSLHSTIFADNPLAAASIYGDYKLWKDIKGLQLEGRVEKITGARALASATSTYLKRHPFVKEFLSDPAAISSEVAGKMSKIAMYAFRPESIFYVNNEAGFGNRWKLEIKKGRVVSDPIQA